MSQSEVIESNSQLIETWKYFTSHFPRVENREIDGLAITWSNTENILLNVIFVSKPVFNEADLEARITAARDYAQQHCKPWMMTVCDDWLGEQILPQATEIFARHELAPFINITGMAADELLPPTRSLANLDCFCVDNPDKRRAVADINAISYGMPPELCRELLESEKFWGKTVFGSVGYIEGQAVSTAVTLLIDGRFYLAWVATLPEYRQRGYAETVIRHSLYQAEHSCGIHRTVLHATPAGFPLYQRMGYYAVTNFQAYSQQSNGKTHI
ncbi:MAG: GNAT family N-acetyltransferase [Coleofasciculaceae cyanobacterium]